MAFTCPPFQDPNATIFLPSDTLAGTADWLIQKETHDMATSKMEGT